MAKKLTAATARTITAEWAERFPAFAVWRPLRLLRRLGPVVQGITLDRSTGGECYYPTAHLHALTRDFPVVALEVSHRLAGSSGVQEVVEVARHGEAFPAVAERLAEQSPLPLGRVPTLDEVVSAYRDRAAALQRGRLPAGIGEWEAAVLVPAAAGAEGLAARSLAAAGEAAGGWSRSEAPQGWGSTGEWLTGLRARAADRPALERVVEEQVTRHGLAELPNEPLTEG